MTEAQSILESLKGFGGYTTTVTLVIGGLLTWWKVLPSLIDAISNRQSKIEERMGDLLDKATQRFERELAASDKRHEDCMAGQVRLVDRIDVLERENGELSKMVQGLTRQITQMQVSAIRTDGASTSPMIAAAVDALGRVPGIGEEK